MNSQFTTGVRQHVSKPPSLPTVVSSLHPIHPLLYLWDCWRMQAKEASICDGQLRKGVIFLLYILSKRFTLVRILLMAHITRVHAYVISNYRTRTKFK